MGRYLWSEGASKRHEDSQARERAYQARKLREAREATEAAWADWNHAEAQARGMGLDITAITPAEDAGWRAIGQATATLLGLIEERMSEPYVDTRQQDADAAGWGYRSGGPDVGDRGADDGEG